MEEKPDTFSRSRNSLQLHPFMGQRYYVFFLVLQILLLLANATFVQ